jgi:hypothetical protein
MSGDQRRDREKSDSKSRDSLQSRDALTSHAGRPVVRQSEFEMPTRPRGRTIDESEAPPPDSLAAALHSTRDSFHPVRVPARSSRPPMSLWTRAWGTAALVIVVGGGAIGIVASLRASALMTGRSAPDQSKAAAAAPLPEHRATRASLGMKALPAAAPGLAPPAPPLPASAMRVASSQASGSLGPVGETSALSASPRPAASVPFRTLDSLAVSPPPVPSAPPVAIVAAVQHRLKPAETASRSSRASLVSDDGKERSAEAPGTSDLPGTKAESEAWITEERRF